MTDELTYSQQDFQGYNLIEVQQFIQVRAAFKLRPVLGTFYQ